MRSKLWGEGQEEGLEEELWLKCKINKKINT